VRAGCGGGDALGRRGTARRPTMINATDAKGESGNPVVDGIVRAALQ